MGRIAFFTRGVPRVPGAWGRASAGPTLAAIAAVLVALSGCGSGSSDEGSAPDYERALAGAPKPLARLYDQANELLPGGTEAFERRLAALRGYPVVVNKWASWCGPCREEFPWFQDLSAKFGKRVAFVGVDSQDNAAAARTFLGELPVPYPSYSDPGEDIARYLEATVGFPATVFYDSRGRPVYVRQGQYPSRAALAADIRRYARGG
jgi:cytochrome c biogenesis protein CcmG, thiol:disulfide interchange protein DsbE